MIPYQGGPLTPEPCAVRVWTGGHALISHAAPQQLPLAAEASQSFILDNGEFSRWKAKRPTDWPAFYRWVAEWRGHPGFDFAIVPDSIDGGEAENDRLEAEWPFPKHQGAVVWHVNESVDRLVRLAKTWPRVAIGSSGDYDVASPAKFLAHVLPILSLICDERRRPICALHGLRMLNPEIYTKVPLKSGDSANIARNIGIDNKWKGTYLPPNKEVRAMVMQARIEAYNSPGQLDEESFLKGRLFYGDRLVA